MTNMYTFDLGINMNFHRYRLQIALYCSLTYVRMYVLYIFTCYIITRIRIISVSVIQLE